MNNINDPRNIVGMADILIDDEEDIDIETIERSITQGLSFIDKPEKKIDLAKEYTYELDLLSKKFNVGGVTGNAPDLNDDDDNLLNWSPDELKSSIIPPPRSSQYPEHRSIPSKNSSYTIKDDDDDDDEHDNEDEHDSSDNNNSHNIDRDRDNYSYSNQYNSTNNHSGWGGEQVHSSWSGNKDHENNHQLKQMTREERNQSHIHNVLGDMEKTDRDNNFIDVEDEEDEMARVLEQIDLLRTTLESEGINLDRIQEVSSGTPRKEAKGILKILQIKNDRLRYADLFEECLLSCSYGLEGLFDGKKEW
jgi:hypothetical protein